MTVSADKYKGRTILVVEDDNISRTLFREIFKNTGCSLKYTNSAAETFEFFESNPPPNLVLMDIRLPDVMGVELTKKLKTKYPDLVVVAQTAFAYQNLEDECMEAGMVAFLSKPIQQSKLFSLLDRLEW